MMNDYYVIVAAITVLLLATSSSTTIVTAFLLQKYPQSSSSNNNSNVPRRRRRRHYQRLGYSSKGDLDNFDGRRRRRGRGRDDDDDLISNKEEDEPLEDSIITKISNSDVPQAFRQVSVVNATTTTTTTSSSSSYSIETIDSDIQRVAISLTQNLDTVDQWKLFIQDGGSINPLLDVIVSLYLSYHHHTSRSSNSSGTSNNKTSSYSSYSMMSNKIKFSLKSKKQQLLDSVGAVKALRNLSVFSSLRL